MRIELAKSAGFCYGVRRAVALAERAAAEGRPCAMLGPVIHNRNVTDYLRALGVGLIRAPEEAEPGTAVIIRSHGEGRETHRRLAERGCPVIDATCPNVSRIHRIVEQAEGEGRQVIIIGTPTHPEVEAIAGWCARPLVFGGAEELSQWLAEAPARREAPLTMVSQTTLTQEVWGRCVEIAKKVLTQGDVCAIICEHPLRGHGAGKRLEKISKKCLTNSASRDIINELPTREGAAHRTLKIEQYRSLNGTLLK